MSEKQPPKLQFQHHVPRFYLKGWSTTVATIPNRVWVYRKDCPPRSSAIKATAGRPNMYATVRVDGTFEIERVERYLADVESRAGKILPKILQHKPINRSEKETMALFLSVMYRRGPYTMDAFAPQSLKPMIPQLRDELIAKYSDPNDDQELRNQKIDAVDIVVRVSEENLSSVTSEALLSSGRMAAFFVSLPWSFFYTDSEPFVTSDCPIIFNRFAGVRDLRNCNILFPISSKIMLLMSPLMPYPSGYSEISGRLVQDLNRRIIWNAFREVYADRRSDWVGEYVVEHIGKGLPRESE